MEIQELAKRMRLKALEMAFKSGKNGAHLGGGLSVIEIMATLYGGVLRLDFQDPYDENRDRLVVSKGHCVLAYYTALREAGFITDEEIDSFETIGACLHGHACRSLKKGIEFSGGSLSMGFSFAVGQAIACKKKKLNNRVYCIVGDGECDEGLIWEAAMAASNFSLSNLTVIIDKNNLQYDGSTVCVMNSDSLADKFRSFGFETYEIDGHDCEVLLSVLTRKNGKPVCIVANTVKGKGVSFMEGVREWHHGVLSQIQYEQAAKEVENG
ncbi:MAG: transketolase [Odoribacter sp.]